MARGVFKVLFRFALWIAVITYIVAALFFNSSREIMYGGLDVRIQDSIQRFVIADSVSAWLEPVVTELEGKQLDRFALNRMESILKDKPYIQYVQVYSDMDGRCIVELSQRDVIFRVLSESGHDFFVDSTGCRLNPHGVWQKQVPVITTDSRLPFDIDEYGYITDSIFSQKTCYYFKNLCKFAKELRDDPFLANFITQTKITGVLEPGREVIHLIPRFGRQRIVLGDFSDLSEKLENVSLFYSGVFKDGWGAVASDVCFQYGDKIIVKRK